MAVRDPGWGRGPEAGNIVLTINGFTGRADLAGMGCWQVDENRQVYVVLDEPLTVGTSDLWVSLLCQFRSGGAGADTEVDILRIGPTGFDVVTPTYAAPSQGGGQDQLLEVLGLKIPWYPEEAALFEGGGGGRFGMIARMTVTNVVADTVHMQIEGDGLRVV